MLAVGAGCFFPLFFSFSPSLGAAKGIEVQQKKQEFLPKNSLKKSDNSSHSKKLLRVIHIFIKFKINGCYLRRINSPFCFTMSFLLWNQFLFFFR